MLRPIQRWMDSIQRGRSRSRLLACLAVAVGAVVAAGCGSQTESAGSAAVVGVTERDFAVLVPKRVPAGDVVLRVRNRGPGSHELLVVKAPSSDLPFRSDGLTVDEDSLSRDEAGVLEPDLPGVVRNLRVHLAPGRYVLFCNMSGHYLGGMHAELVVA